MKKKKKDKYKEMPMNEGATTIREQSKEMSRAARQVARSYGKRITMSMFITEDLI